MSLPKLSLPLLLALAALAPPTGCRRKPTQPPAPPAESPKAPTTSPATNLSAPAAKAPAPVPDHLPTAPNDAALRSPVNQELTGAIHLHLTDYQQLPPDFETLVQRKYLKALPKPPPGKRFALDRNRMQVVVLD